MVITMDNFTFNSEYRDPPSSAMVDTNSSEPLNGSKRQHYFSEYYDPFYRDFQLVTEIVHPTLFCVGTVLNIVAFLVFTRSRLRVISSVQYIAGVAVSDTIFLISWFVTRLYYLYGVVFGMQPGVCQFANFFNYVCNFLSAWYLVALAVDSFIGVYWPLRKRNMCTVFRARCVMVGLAVLAIVGNSYVIYTTGPTVSDNGLTCFVWDEFKVAFFYLNKVETVVALLLPWFIILVLTLLILIRGCEYYRISAAAVELCPRSAAGRTDAQQSLRVTKIVFPLLIVMILVNGPLGILRFLAVLGLISKTAMAFKMKMSLEFINIIGYGVKTLVYLAFSGSFRHRSRDLMYNSVLRMRGRCQRDSSMDSESDPQRITMGTRPKGTNQRECLMQSYI